ncbi:MAG: DNA-directed RNA polymerase subunit omega [Brevinematia bacterium]
MKDFFEKLIDYDGNHYELAVAASKRAAFLVNKNIIPNTSEKPAVKALYEILTKEVEILDTSKDTELEEE